MNDDDANAVKVINIDVDDNDMKNQHFPRGQKFPMMMNDDDQHPFKMTKTI